MDKVYKLKDAQELIKCTKYICVSLDLRDWEIFINKLVELGCDINRYKIPIFSPYIYVDQDLVITSGSAKDSIQWYESDFRSMDPSKVVNMILESNLDQSKTGLEFTRKQLEFIISKNIDYFKYRLNIVDKCIKNEFGEFDIGDHILVEYSGFTNKTYEFYRLDNFIDDKINMTKIKICIPNCNKNQLIDSLDSSYRVTVGTVVSSLDFNLHKNVTVKKVPKRIFDKLFSIHVNKQKQLNKIKVESMNNVILTLKKSNILNLPNYGKSSKK